MKKIFSILILILICIVPNITFSAGIDEGYIDVKIGGNTPLTEVIRLSSDDGFYLYEKDHLDYPIYKIDDLSLYISAENGNILVMNSSLKEIYRIPGDGSIVIGSGNIFESLVRVGENRYRGYITFLLKDTIYTINHIYLEDYLYGVVPREMPALSHSEALKAQSVASRSFAYTNVKKHLSEGYNLCDTTHCQVYKGYDNEHSATNMAIDQTYGEYVTYNGKIVETPYHSNSGGMTESSANAWGGNVPYLMGVEDRFSENTQNSSWQVEISLRDMEKKLSDAGIYLGNITGFEILKVTSSYRVQSLRVIGSLGEKIVSGVELQRILSLRSRWFDIISPGATGSSASTKVYVIDGQSIYPVEVDMKNVYVYDGGSKAVVNRSSVNRAISSTRTVSFEQSGSVYDYSPDRFIISGRGNGHGVGMSQYGAMEMAKQGYNYEEIIKHYYSGTEITYIGK